MSYEPPTIEQLAARADHAAWRRGEDVPGMKTREPVVVTPERWAHIMGDLIEPVEKGHTIPCNCWKHRDDDPDVPNQPPVREYVCDACSKPKAQYTLIPCSRADELYEQRAIHIVDDVVRVPGADGVVSVNVHTGEIVDVPVQYA